jgi:hypothetical protein
MLIPAFNMSPGIFEERLAKPMVRPGRTIRQYEESPFSEAAVEMKSLSDIPMSEEGNE